MQALKRFSRLRKPQSAIGRLAVVAIALPALIGVGTMAGSASAATSPADPFTLDTGNTVYTGPSQIRQFPYTGHCLSLTGGQTLAQGCHDTAPATDPQRFNLVAVTVTDLRAVITAVQFKTSLGTCLHASAIAGGPISPVACNASDIGQLWIQESDYDAWFSTGSRYESVASYLSGTHLCMNTWVAPGVDPVSGGTGSFGVNVEACSTAPLEQWEVLSV